jgi:hypothetical protein
MNSSQKKWTFMGRNKSEPVSCEVCGNDQGHCFEVRLGGVKHVFDTFECAMRALTPHCGYCGCQLSGDGIVLGNTIYCSYQCANDDGTREYERRVLSKERADF